MSSSSSSPYQLPAVGDSLDIFSLRAELHKGALTTLFLAEDMLTLEQVVLKIPCGDILNQPILLYHYQNEERISRRLDHPGIIRFINRQRSRQYIIMEYVLGRDLRSMVGTNRTLELDQALSLMQQLCRVVAYLHDQHIVHLDLKPENILYLDDLTIKVIDFGLASCGDLPDLLALDMQNPQGTPWYIAPEQLLGERDDPRCDIYSMGMLLYEMLTGRLPWPRSSKLQIARRRLRHDPTPPRHYNREIPPQIQSIILRAIARHASNRYSRIEEMQNDLQHWRQLPVTDVGRQSKPNSLWRRLFPGNAIKKNFTAKKRAEISSARPQIIGAFIDSPNSDDLLMELKKQALIRSCDVTLVHVIEEESDSHFLRYGIAVEGEKLMTRLERAVQQLRRCSIDPSIRLIRGEAVEVLRNIADSLNAELLLLGKSRKKKGLWGDTSVPRRLRKNSPCPVAVAEEERFAPATDLGHLQPSQLTAEHVLACDIFLVDLWYEHLHYHTDLIYRKLLESGLQIDSGEDNCLFGRWLETLEISKEWQEVISSLKAIHRQFHQVVAHMIELEEHDHIGLLDLYLDESLPLSCSLKNELGQVSLKLRDHLELKPEQVPFLADETCPVEMPNLAGYGPVLSAFNLEQDLSTLIRKKEKNPQPPDAASTRNN